MSLECFIAIFEILSFEKFILDIDISPNFIDVENSVFCFCSDRSSYTLIDVHLMSSLMSFINCSSIKELTLQGCSFSDEAFTVLCDLIKMNTSLVSIDFTSIVKFSELDGYDLDEYETLCDDDFSVLISALQSNCHLKKINLGDSFVEFSSLLSIFELIWSGNLTPNIKIFPHSIDFSLGVIRYEGGGVRNSDLILLLKALKSNVPIKRVECRGLKTVSLEVLITLYEIYSINKSVLDFNVHPHLIDVANGLFRFSSKQVTEISSKKRLRSLVNCVGMTELVINNCRFHAKPFSDLCDFIRSNGSNSYSKLTKIDLRFNSVGNEQAIELANALEANSVISEINLYGNSIDCETKQLITRLSNNRIKT
ncbi:hypothetical protein GEMRC1_002490 [Eukaryota sp. GEM-RC1]